jgi:hypothetical protein
MVLGPHRPSPLPPNGLHSLAPHHVSMYHATPIPTVSPEHFAEANQNCTRLYSESRIFGVDFRGREGYGGDSRGIDSWTTYSGRRLRRHAFPRERGYRGDSRVINGARGYLFEMIGMARLSPREGISLGVHFREREGRRRFPDTVPRLLGSTIWYQHVDSIVPAPNSTSNP